PHFRDIIALSNPRYQGTDLKSLLAKITGSGADDDAARITVVNAAKGAATATIALCGVARDATALRDTGANGALKKVRDDLAALGNAKLNGIITIIDGAKSDAISLKADIQGAIDTLTNKIQETVTAAGAQKYLDELLTLVLNASTVVDSIQSKIVQ